jgi:hypothetical protein
MSAQGLQAPGSIGWGGTLELDRRFRPGGPASVRLEAHRQTRTLEIPGDDCFHREIEHLAAAIRGQTPANITLDDSARWITVTEEIERRASGWMAARSTTTP